VTPALTFNRDVISAANRALASYEAAAIGSSAR
jgi:hypothetical protein